MPSADRAITAMIEVLEKGRPTSEVTRILWSHAEKRIAFCERKIRKFKERYESFESLQNKILAQKHTLEEERDLFNWEANQIELRRLKKLLGSKPKN